MWSPATEQVVVNGGTVGTSNGQIHRVCLTLPDNWTSEDKRRTQAVASNQRPCLTIDGYYGTTLEKVGLQVWKGSLLLSELAFARRQCLSCETVLELGCGVGMAAIALAINGANVFATDYDSEVLEFCTRNIEKNASLFDPGNIRVRRLNWRTFDPAKRPEATDHFDFTEDEWTKMINCKFICAADALYDFKLNEALFSVITELCKFGKKTIYFSLEKRLVFTAHSLGVSSPFYEHFEEWIWDMKEKGWHAEKMNLDLIPKIWMPSRSSLMIDCLIANFFEVFAINTRMCFWDYCSLCIHYGDVHVQFSDARFF
ncbi:unnamed protein product [Soboliphyme baturini]|uniref:Methyltransferase n=1 Tax=Soboliphyme baturini TaxID=241478 RepID=A0A183IEK7_9BILA|nr:unnamed protein product [Soboliphyme baturini]